MTRQQYLVSVGWNKVLYNSRIVNKYGYAWVSPDGEWHRDFAEAWAAQMAEEGKPESWRPTPEIRTGRLKS